MTALATTPPLPAPFCFAAFHPPTTVSQLTCWRGRQAWWIALGRPAGGRTIPPTYPSGRRHCGAPSIPSAAGMQRFWGGLPSRTEEDKRKSEQRATLHGKHRTTSSRLRDIVQCLSGSSSAATCAATLNLLTYSINRHWIVGMGDRLSAVGHSGNEGGTIPTGPPRMGKQRSPTTAPHRTRTHHCTRAPASHYWTWPARAATVS